MNGSRFEYFALMPAQPVFYNTNQFTQVLFWNTTQEVYLDPPM